MTNDGNQPAFPVPTSSLHQGVSKRDWLAAMALQGLLAKGIEVRGDRAYSPEERDQLFANKAYGLADAMLATANEAVATT